MLSMRLSLFLFFLLGAAILFFVLFRDVTYARIHVQQSFPDHPPPLRPPYPPFHPPNLDDVVPPSPPPQPDFNWSESHADASQLRWASRALSVKEAFVRTYHSYERYAPFPADELQPVSNASVKK